MIVERVKYVIWAADMDRAVRFYRGLFQGRLLKQNAVIAEVEILGSTLGIHSGGNWMAANWVFTDVINIQAIGSSEKTASRPR